MREVIYEIEELDNGIVLRQEEEGYDPYITCEKFSGNNYHDFDEGIIKFLGDAFWADVYKVMEAEMTNKLKIKLIIEKDND